MSRDGNKKACKRVEERRGERKADIPARDRLMGTGVQKEEDRGRNRML